MKYNRCNPTWIQRKVIYPIWRFWIKFTGRFKFIHILRKFRYEFRIMNYEIKKLGESAKEAGGRIREYRELIESINNLKKKE